MGFHSFLVRLKTLWVIAQVLERQRGQEAEEEENEKKRSDNPVEKVRRIFSVGANPFDLWAVGGFAYPKAGGQSHDGRRNWKKVEKNFVRENLVWKWFGDMKKVF